MQYRQKRKRRGQTIPQMFHLNLGFGEIFDNFVDVDRLLAKLGRLIEDNMSIILKDFLIFIF